MDNLNMELPRKLDAATIAALFPDLDAVRSRVANWLRFLDRVSRERNFPLYAAALDDEGDDLLREVQQALDTQATAVAVPPGMGRRNLALLAARYATQEYHSAAERIGQAQQRCSFVFPVFWSGYDVTPVLPAKRQPGGPSAWANTATT